jgi:UDPglucose--hexose-1-phosphate uridylyltransferase
VRVVPNLYPAVERQEVVVHSPRHVRSFAELTDDEIAAVSSAWLQRAGAGVEDGFPYVHALINEGQAAGSSLPHSHSQLVFLREPPPAVRDEVASGAREILASRELLVSEEEGIKAVVHPAGRLPYELLIAAEAGGLVLSPALRLLRDAVTRLRAVEGPVPWNAWLHEGAHPHIEVVPRLTVMAGLELGAGIYVNSLDPVEAAARLRNA